LGNTEKGVILTLIVAMLLALESAMVKLCYGSGFDANSILAFRMSLGAAIFLAGSLIGRQKLFLPRKHWRYAAFLILVFFFTCRAYYLAIGRLPMATAVLFFFLYPVFTALIAWFWRREHLGMGKIASLFISIAGILIFSLTSLGKLDIWGVALALLAAIGQAVYMVFLEDFLKKDDASGHAFLNTMLPALGIIYFVMMLTQGHVIVPGNLSGWFPMMILAFFCTAVAIYLSNLGILLAGATLAAIVCTMEVPFAAAMAYLFFGDRWTPWQFVGAVCIFIAVLMVNVPFLNKRDKRVLPEPIKEKKKLM